MAGVDTIGGHWAGNNYYNGGVVIPIRPRTRDALLKVPMFGMQRVLIVNISLEENDDKQVSHIFTAIICVW